MGVTFGMFGGLVGLLLGVGDMTTARLTTCDATRAATWIGNALLIRTCRQEVDRLRWRCRS